MLLVTYSWRKIVKPDILFMYGQYEKAQGVVLTSKQSHPNHFCCQLKTSQGERFIPPLSKSYDIILFANKWNNIKTYKISILRLKQATLVLKFREITYLKACIYKWNHIRIYLSVFSCMFPRYFSRNLKRFWNKSEAIFDQL